MRSPRVPLIVDVCLAAALTLSSVLILLDRSESRWPAIVLVIFSIAPVAMRQRAPFIALASVATALVVFALLGYGDWPSGALGLLITLFTVATLRSRLAAAGAFAVTVTVLVVVSAVGPDGAELPLILQAVLAALCAWVVGESTRRWSLTATEAAARAERSVAEERASIARDLHDVVSHHMAVVALQAGVAEYVLSSDPTAARTAIVNAGAAGREAINDLGRVLDALRDTSDPAPMQPQPVLAELPRLVDRFKTSGVEVTLVVTDAEDVPPSVQMTAFRIVQEALTNVVKHVGPSARAEVTVDRCQDRLVVEVRDFGSALASRKATGSGLGLHNMRERAALVGGTLRAGPSATGFLVQLVIPLGAGVHGQYALQKR